MFDLSLVELLFIAVLAVLVLGPKEFPTALRALAKGIAQLKSMGDELRAGVSSLAEESGISEVKKEMEAEANYIIDQQGEYQRIYDISEFLEEDKAPKISGKSDF